MVQRRGGATFLEFRTWQRDTARHGRSPSTTAPCSHPTRVVAEIERYGGTVVHREVGTGDWHRSTARTHTSVDS